MDEKTAQRARTQHPNGRISDQQRQKHKIRGKVFYLEIKNNPKLEARLESYIEKFGGIISKFFDAKVHYVINLGGQKAVHSVPQQHQQQQQSASSSQAPSPSPNPSRKVAALPFTSRAQKLLAASKTSTTVQKPPTTPSAQPGKSAALKPGFDCKYLDAQELYTYFHNILREEKRAARAALEEELSKSRKITKLKEPCIKISDTAGLYRSLYKEFDDFPTLNENFEATGELCPFAKAGQSSKVKQEQKKDAPVQSGAAPPTASPAGAAAPTLIQENPTNGQQMTPEIQNTGNSRIITPRNTDTTGHARLTTNGTGMTTRSKKKKAVGNFCELCSMDFEDFDQHMNCPQHIKATSAPGFFHVLENLAASIPNKFKERENKNFPIKRLRSSLGASGGQQNPEFNNNEDQTKPVQCSFIRLDDLTNKNLSQQNLITVIQQNSSGKESTQARPV